MGGRPGGSGKAGGVSPPGPGGFCAPYSFSSARMSVATGTARGAASAWWGHRCPLVSKAGDALSRMACPYTFRLFSPHSYRRREHGYTCVERMTSGNLRLWLPRRLKRVIRTAASVESRWSDGTVRGASTEIHAYVPPSPPIRLRPAAPCPRPRSRGHISSRGRSGRSRATSRPHHSGRRTRRPAVGFRPTATGRRGSS